MNDPMKEAIDSAKNCQQVCQETLEYCRSKGGDHAEEAHLKLLEDCAKICETAVDFMERGSTYHGQICGLCADICEACAEDCDKFEGDEQMQKCAEACRTCAEHCRAMSNM